MYSCTNFRVAFCFHVHISIALTVEHLRLAAEATKLSYSQKNTAQQHVHLIEYTLIKVMTSISTTTKYVQMLAVALLFSESTQVSLFFSCSVLLACEFICSFFPHVASTIQSPHTGSL